MQVPGWTCQKNKQSCAKSVENRYLCVLVGKGDLDLLKFKWGGKNLKFILIRIHFQELLWLFRVHFGSGVLIVLGVFCRIDIKSGFGEVWWIPEIKHTRGFPFFPLESRRWLIWDDLCKCEYEFKTVRGVCEVFENGTVNQEEGRTEKKEGLPLKEKLKLLIN